MLLFWDYEKTQYFLCIKNFCCCSLHLSAKYLKCTMLQDLFSILWFNFVLLHHFLYHKMEIRSNVSLKFFRPLIISQIFRIAFISKHLGYTTENESYFPPPPENKQVVYILFQKMICAFIYYTKDASRINVLSGEMWNPFVCPLWNHVWIYF